MESLVLPKLPHEYEIDFNAGIIKPEQLTRTNLKGLIHELTAKLKDKGTKTPHILLPYRSKVLDDKLEALLSSLFPRGVLVEQSAFQSVLEEHNEFTLICLLKFLWSRLPNNEIIGWDIYLEFKRREREAGYPSNAFLDIMPKCLHSPAHASIVYDFLDILVSIASNSQYNFLSGRKIAKMSSLWAFNGSNRFHSAFFDATVNEEHDFIKGLEIWKESSDALFHLLLSFLRSMLPESDTLKLPKTLQSLLISTSYPPLENSDSVKMGITIPCIVISSTKISSNVYELLSKVRRTLSFEKKDAFLSIENYTILKNIFDKPSTSEIVSSLTDESRRILSRLSAEPIDSSYGLIPGWSKFSPKTDPEIPLYSHITICDVTLQDYYIWTWLSSLASDQNDHIKSIFGRSIVVEASLRGFQKWILVTEKTMNTEDYLKNFHIKPHIENVDSTISHTNYESTDNSKKVKESNNSYNDIPLPPPPVPAKDENGFLPNYYFSNFKDDMKSTDEESFIFPSTFEENEKKENLEKKKENLYRTFSQSLNITASDKKQRHRRPPPSAKDSALLASNNSSSALKQTIFKPMESSPPVSFDLKEKVNYIQNQQEDPQSSTDKYVKRVENKKVDPKFSEPYEDYYLPQTNIEQHDEFKEPFESYKVKYNSMQTYKDNHSPKNFTTSSTPKPVPSESVESYNLPPDKEPNRNIFGPYDSKNDIKSSDKANMLIQNVAVVERNNKKTSDVYTYNSVQSRDLESASQIEKDSYPAETSSNRNINPDYFPHHSSPQIKSNSNKAGAPALSSQKNKDVKFGHSLPSMLIPGPIMSQEIASSKAVEHRNNPRMKDLTSDIQHHQASRNPHRGNPDSKNERSKDMGPILDKARSHQELDRIKKYRNLPSENEEEKSNSSSSSLQYKEIIPSSQTPTSSQMNTKGLNSLVSHGSQGPDDTLKIRIDKDKEKEAPILQSTGKYYVSGSKEFNKNQDNDHSHDIHAGYRRSNMTMQQPVHGLPLPPPLPMPNLMVQQGYYLPHPSFPQMPLQTPPRTIPYMPPQMPPQMPTHTTPYMPAQISTKMVPQTIPRTPPQMSPHNSSQSSFQFSNMTHMPPSVPPQVSHQIPYQIQQSSNATPRTGNYPGSRSLQANGNGSHQAESFAAGNKSMQTQYQMPNDSAPEISYANKTNALKSSDNYNLPHRNTKHPQGIYVDPNSYGTAMTNRHNKGQKQSKANLRAAFNGSGFGI